MSCCGNREKLGEMKQEQKWDYINLSDFKSNSCLAPISYLILYINIIITIAVYVTDTLTAVNLIAFNRWNSEVKPAIPFTVSKWIFAICIIISWVLLFFELLRAIRVMRRGGIAESYLDPLAVQIQSIRLGRNGRGWRRFLVFAALTRSWLRTVFAEGPRQVVNGVTLYTVMRASIIPIGQHAASDGHSGFTQFFINVESLAESSRTQAVILFSMLFTLVIWLISAFDLVLGCILYILFLWHHIPSTDNGLSGYCRRKIDSRVNRIVAAKIKKTLEKEDVKRRKEQARALKEGREISPIAKKPTVPVLITADDDKVMEMPLLNRQASHSTMASTTSRPPTRAGIVTPGLPRQPTLPDVSSGLTRQPTVPEVSGDIIRPPPPSRSVTQSSAMSDASYASNAPLLGEASAMGYGPPGRSPSPAPPLPTGGFSSGQYNSVPRPAPSRSATNQTQYSQRSLTPSSRPPTAQSRNTSAPTPMPMPTRQNTAPPAITQEPRLPLMQPPNAPGRFPVAIPSRQNTAPGALEPMKQADPRLPFMAEEENRRPPGPSQSPSNPYRPANQDRVMSPAADSYSRRTPVPTSDATDQATPTALQPGRRTPGPSYDTRAQSPVSSPAPTQSPPPNSVGYVAFNPNFHPSPVDVGDQSAQNPHSPPPTSFNAPKMPRQPYQPQQQQQRRNMTAPVASAGLPPGGPTVPFTTNNFYSRPQPQLPPQRSATAPLHPPPASGYDDSIYDAYGDGGEYHGAYEMPTIPQMPPRAATSSPRAGPGGYHTNGGGGGGGVYDSPGGYGYGGYGYGSANAHGNNGNAYGNNSGRLPY
ncbi:MAG: hypothetical protein M1819_001764 [Sarea resinae]|nr:MAG: hypothetical protein M1819_001764 [Sarea resinae]